MNPWEYQRNKAAQVVMDAPQGSEFTVSIGEKFMIVSRQGYAIYASKRILQFLEAAMAKLVESKAHYQPVLDQVREMLKSFDVLLDTVDKADKINKLKEGVAEGQGEC